MEVEELSKKMKNLLEVAVVYHQTLQQQENLSASYLNGRKKNSRSKKSSIKLRTKKLATKETAFKMTKVLQKNCIQVRTII